MKDIRFTGEPRDGEEEFKEIDLKTYTKQVFSMYGGDQRLVEIRFINPLLDAVVDRFGTKDIQHARVDDTPDVRSVSALLIKANENYCFYGNGIQIADATYEYERLKLTMDEYTAQKTRKRIGGKEKLALPQLPKFHLPAKATSTKEIEVAEC